MPRLFLLTFAFVALAISFAFAHPARPLYEPTSPAKAPTPRPSINLNGTSWQGKYLTSNRIFTFEADGTLSYKISAATKISTKNRGIWRFDGDTLTFEYFINANSKLMEFRGELKDSNTLVGESITKTGGKSGQTFTRTRPVVK